MPSVSFRRLSLFRHALASDRVALHKIELHLRDFHRSTGEVRDNIIHNVISEIIDFNCDRLGKTLDMVDRFILKKKVGKTQCLQK